MGFDNYPFPPEQDEEETWTGGCCVWGCLGLTLLFLAAILIGSIIIVFKG